MSPKGHGDDGHVSAARHVAPLAHIVHVGALMFSWYGLGIGLVYVNKFMLSEEQFSFPFITVLVTNLWLWLVMAFLSTFGWFRPPRISWELFKRQAVPTGICTGLDIATANWSLQYLNVTFFTMIRGSIPSFVLTFSMCFGIERIKWPRIGSTLTVCVGIILASMGEMAYHWPGILMCTFSCAIAGARWVLVELMMAKQLPAEELQPVPGQLPSPWLEKRTSGTSPLGAILLVTPVTISACLPFAVIFELRPFLHSRYWRDSGCWREAMAYLAAVTVISFLLTLSKFHLVKATSSLDMSLMGILKQLLTIIGAVSLFGDQLSWVRALGFVTCSSGLVFYNLVEMRARCSEPFDHPTRVTPGVEPWLSRLRRHTSESLQPKPETSETRGLLDDTGSEHSVGTPGCS